MTKGELHESDVLDIDLELWSTRQVDDGDRGVGVNPVHLANHFMRFVRVILCNTLNIKLAHEFGILGAEPSNRLAYLSTHR